MKCLVTQLQGVVNDSTLRKLGEIRVGVNATSEGSNFTIFKVAGVDTELSATTLAGENYLSTSQNGEYVNRVDLEQSTSETNVRIYFKQGEYDVSILPKENLSRLVVDKGGDFVFYAEEFRNLPNMVLFTLKNVSTEFNVDKIMKWSKTSNISVVGQNITGGLFNLYKECPALHTLYVESTSINGDVAELKQTSKMKSLILSSSKGIFGDLLDAIKDQTSMTLCQVLGVGEITGNLSNLKKLKSLQYLRSDSKLLEGDIQELGYCTKIEAILLQSPLILGSIEELVAKFREQGRTQGTLSFENAGTLTGVTYNNVNLVSWLRSNLGKVAFTLTWDSQSITLS